MNPVVLLDEVDKVGSDYRGDPAAALLEVLDPAQNHTFRDHYLELDLDLSDVVFLATANVAEAIPEALVDRMEVVRLDGYTEDEKVAIARDHLLPRQLERAGLTADEVVADPRGAGPSPPSTPARRASGSSSGRSRRSSARSPAQLAAGAATAPVTVDDGRHLSRPGAVHARVGRADRRARRRDRPRRDRRGRRRALRRGRHDGR